MNWSAFWGGFAGNIADIAIVIMLVKVIKQLMQFKREGKGDEWLK